MHSLACWLLSLCLLFVFRKVGCLVCFIHFEKYWDLEDFCPDIAFARNFLFGQCGAVSLKSCPWGSLLPSEILTISDSRYRYGHSCVDILGHIGRAISESGFGMAKGAILEEGLFNRVGILVIASLLLSGCASSLDAIENGSDVMGAEQASQTHVTQPPSEAQAPLPKDAKILTPGSRVNDYVNENLPSQFAHTIQELNKPPLNDQYPTIEDIPQSERRLLTLEERRQLEEELRRLNQAQ